MSRLVVVGSGTVVPEADRGGSCFWLELGEGMVLLDCGPGAVQGLVRWSLAWPRVTDLVLTHFHADHVGGIPGLFFALKHGLLPETREAPLDVWGPPGTRRLFERLADALGGFLLEPGYPLRVHDVAPGGTAELQGGLRLSTHKTPHTDESQAVRIGSPTAQVGYSGDTGPSDTLGPFMAEVDLLVVECSLHDEEVGDNHLSPSRVARIAREARPGRLILTHVYPHLRKVDVAGLVRAAGYADAIVEVAHDGMTLPLPG